jgi:hypothetical protein
MIWFIRGGIHFIKTDYVKQIYKSIFNEKGKSVISIVNDSDDLYDRIKNNKYKIPQKISHKRQVSNKIYYNKILK